MLLIDVATPDTGAARAANQVARRYCSSARYAHSMRCYLWGVASALHERLDLDVELFYVAAMLHDIELAHPFGETGGEVAWVFGAAAGWSDVRRSRVTQIVAEHVWPPVGVETDPEGHTLAIATGIDVSGHGLDRVPAAFQAEVAAAWPRLNLGDELIECLH